MKSLPNVLISVLVFSMYLAIIESPAAAATSSVTDTDDFAVAYQQNFEHTGAARTPNLHIPMHVQWSVDLGQLVSYPIVADGRVFVTAGSNLDALDPRTGQLLWAQTITSTTWVRGAAYEDGLIYAVGASVFAGAAIFAYDDRNGREIWAQSLPGQYSFSSPPAARYGRVFTSGAGSGGTFYALRAVNGRPLWTANVYYGDDSSPVVMSDGVYASYACPQAYKLNPGTGAVIWQYSGPCSGGGGSTPVLYKNLLFVEDSFINSDDGAIINATDGTLISTFNSNTTPAIAQDHAVLNIGNALNSVSTVSGQVQWTTPAPNGDSFASPPSILTSLGLVVDATSNGNLLAYRLKTGHQVFGLPLGYGSDGSAMAASANRLFIPVGTHLVAVGG